VTGKTRPRDVTVTYPRGEAVEDKVIGNYRVYRDKVKMEAVATRAKDDNGPLLVSIRLRPFDDKGCCWRTRTLTKTVP
jgi:hypothetical protein